MRWTALFFLVVTGGLAAAKWAGIGTLAAWAWWQVLAPMSAFAGLWALIIVGTLIHAITRRVLGFDDSRGID